MPDVNSVIFAGRLTRDPELTFYEPKDGSDPRPVANFGLAINRPKRDKNADDVADFFECSVWGAQAEALCNYKGKGDAILLEGRAEYRTWEADDGTKRSRVSFKAFRVQFLGNKGDGQRAEGQGIAQAQGGSQASVNTSGPLAPVRLNEEDFDDIPF